MANKIIHKHSNVVTDGQAKLPTSSQLEYGELAINYADGVETISIRNSADEIIEFRSKEYIDGVLSDTKDKVDTLEIDFEEHEEVVATALTVLNKKIDEFDNIVGTAVNERIESLENAFQEHEEVAAEAINDLDERIKSKSNVGHTHVSSNITGTISAASGITSNTTLLTQGKAVYNYAAPKNHTHQDITNKIDELKNAVEDNEFVVSSALHELNERVKGNEDNITNINVSINKNKTIDVTPLFKAEGFIPNISIQDISDKHLVYYSLEGDTNANITFLPVQNIKGNPFYGVLMADVFVPDGYDNGEMRTSQYSIKKYVNFIYSKTIDGVYGIYAIDDAIELSGYMISPFNFVEKNDILTNLNEIKSLDVTPLFTQDGTIEGIGIDELSKKTLYYNGIEGETDVPAKLYPIGDDSSTTMGGGRHNKAILICEKIITADDVTTAPSVFNTSTFVSLIEEKFDEVNNIVSVECLSVTKKSLSGNQVNPKITNTLNVTDINAIKAAQLLLNESNDVAFFLITDSQGNLPSKNQDAVSVSKECIKQLSLSSPNSSVQNILKNISDDGIKTKGMSVGDIIALSRVPVSIDALGNYLELSSTIISALKLLGLSTIEIYQYKIWSTNDAKWTNYYNPDGSVVTEGVAGLVSPWAQDMIGKVPEAVLRPTKYAWGTNFDEMLENGVLSYGPPSGGAAPGGLDENFTVIVDASTTPDGNGYYTIKQTALGRTGLAEGKIFERFIFYNPSTNAVEPWGWKHNVDGLGSTAFIGEVEFSLNKDSLILADSFILKNENDYGLVICGINGTPYVHVIVRMGDYYNMAGKTGGIEWDVTFSIGSVEDIDGESICQLILESYQIKNSNSEYIILSPVSNYTDFHNQINSLHIVDGVNNYENVQGLYSGTMGGEMFLLECVMHNKAAGHYLQCIRGNFNIDSSNPKKLIISNKYRILTRGCYNNSWTEWTDTTSTFPKKVILLGDSQMGQCRMELLLESKLNNTVYNFGFSGSRWAHRSDMVDYNPFSTKEVISTLCTKDTTNMDNSVANVQSGNVSEYQSTLNRFKTFINGTDMGDGSGFIVVISSGGNDYNGKTPLGTADSTDDTTLLGSINNALSALYTTYPAISVIVVTPTFRMMKNASGETVPSDEYTHWIEPIGQMNRCAYGDKIIEHVKEHFHTRTFDMYRNGGRNKYNIYTICPDGTHPTSDIGKKLTAEIYEKMIRSI